MFDARFFHTPVCKSPGIHLVKTALLWEAQALSPDLCKLLPHKSSTQTFTWSPSKVLCSTEKSRYELCNIFRALNS